MQGQYDEHGRNRQANWYYFRMDGVKGRDITLTLTDFVGEYDGKPGACPMNPDTIPVFSDDDEHWRHFPAMSWDDAKKEATLTFRPEHDRIWIAHLPPYTHRRLLRLLEQIDRSPAARVEVIGKTARGRDLHLVTVTNFDRPDDGKRTVWLQARQHAWEAGTSYVMEGALEFVTSDEPVGPRAPRQGRLQVHPDARPGRLRDGQGPVQRQRLRREPPLGRGRPPPQGVPRARCPRSGTRRRPSWPTSNPAARST